MRLSRLLLLCALVLPFTAHTEELLTPPWNIDVAIDPSEYPEGALPVDGGLAPGQVALTFDDGPNPKLTPGILDTLDRYDVKATFFVVGWRAKLYPELVQEIIRRGHTVASHTYKHRYLNLIPFEEAQAEIVKGHRLVLRAAGTFAYGVTPFFRFPGGRLNANSKLLERVHSLGLVAFHWNISSHDTSAPERADAEIHDSGAQLTHAERDALIDAIVLRYIVRDLGRYGSGIVLFHDTKQVTSRVLPDVLEELRRPRRLKDTAQELGVTRFSMVRFVKAATPPRVTPPPQRSLQALPPTEHSPRARHLQHPGTWHAQPEEPPAQDVEDDKDVKRPPQPLVTCFAPRPRSR